MRDILKALLTVTLVVIFCSSCSKKWLEPEPLSFFAPENVYVNKEGFESGLITLRKNLKSEYYGIWSHITGEFASSDLAVAGYEPNFSINTPTNFERIPYGAMFDNVYSYIKDANVIISRIDDIKWANETDKNRILAEALWHRAYWYYRLIHSYGDIPFVGQELKAAKLDFFTHSRWTILTKIQQDLEWAVEWLPVLAAVKIPTKGAGNHLLTKVYLANTEFDKAILSATKVIDGPYSLMQARFGSMAKDTYRNVIWDLHRHENIYNNQNTETILGIVDRFDAPDGAKENQSHASKFIPHYWDVPDESGARGIYYPSVMMDTLMRGQGALAISRFYQFDIWKDETTKWNTTSDLRRSDINWIEMSEIKYNLATSPNYNQPIKKLWKTTQDTTIRWYSWPHYKTYNPSNQAQSTWGGGNGDTYVYRLAETYLLRAEAHYWKGNLSAAAEDINKVRSRAKASLVTAGSITIDYIFDERARELYTEEPRHSELVRVSNIMAKLNMFGYNLNTISQKNWWFDRIMRVNEIYKMPSGTWWQGKSAAIKVHNLYWAIPNSVIIANTLGRINQNIGYQGAENNVPPLEVIE